MSGRFDPGMPLARISAAPTVRRWRDGRLMADVQMELPPEYVEQIRQGYRCMKCFHGPQPEPFPAECVEPFCRFPMRTRQMELFELMYEGDSTPPDPPEPDYEREAYEEGSRLLLPGRDF